MLLVRHFDVSPRAAVRVLFEKARVASFQDVDLGIEDFRVVFNMKVSVYFSEGFIQERASLLTKLTMKDDRRAIQHHLFDELAIFEECLLDLFGVAEVSRADDMSSLEFIVEPTVDDHDFPA